MVDFTVANELSPGIKPYQQGKAQGCSVKILLSEGNEVFGAGRAS